MKDGTLRAGAFELREVVGRGACATVWRAAVASGDAAFAVKVLDQAHGTGFQRELNAVARLDHPAIALVVDHGVIGPAEACDALRCGAPFIVMELAQGTLAPSCGHLEWPQILQILLRLLAALGHAHARGILHRDLKPQNLLLTPGGVQLADFGLARVAGVPGSSEGDSPLSGTPAYMAPEQCEGSARDHTPATDLYAVGGVAWALASSHPPFGHGLAAIHGHLALSPPRFRARCEVPAGFEAWIRRLLEKKPEHRFDRAVCAARALADLGGAEPPQERSERRSLAVRGAALRLFGLREMPVIGRSTECGVLEEALATVLQEHRPQAILLEGPTGVGKSHLARWLCERAHEAHGLEILRIGHAEIPDARHGWRSAILDAFDCDGLSDDERALRIATVLHLPLSSPLCQDLDPWVDPSSAVPTGQAAIVGWIHHLCRARGLVLAIDEVQWCDESLLDTLKELLGSAIPLLIVGTLQREALAELPGSRRETIEAFRALAGTRTLSVGSVPPEQQQALVHELLPLEPGLAERVAERTAGNPLFVRHLLADWVGRDLLEVGTEGFRLKADPQQPLPSSLGAAWQARIERFTARLAPGERVALALAARLGRRVDSDEWSRACRLVDATPTDALVDALVVAGLADLEPRGLSFVHGMLRESIVDGSAADGRATDLEMACARVLQDQVPKPFARIGRHLVAAGALEPALDPLYLGATRELQLGNPGAVHALLAERERALLSLRCAGDDPRWAEQMLVGTEIALFLHRDVPAARATAHAARALLERSGGRPIRLARALQLIALVESQEGGAVRALPWLDEAARVVEHADAPWLRANIAAARLNARVTLGQHLDETERELEQLLEAPGDRPYVLLQLASIARLRLDGPALAERTARAEALFLAERRPDGLAACLLFRGDCARWSGDRPTARRLYAEAATLSSSPPLADALVLSNALLLEEEGDRSWVPSVDALIEDATRTHRLETLTGAHPVRLLATLSKDGIDLAAFTHHLEAALHSFSLSQAHISQAHEAVLLGLRSGQLPPGPDDRGDSER